MAIDTGLEVLSGYNLGHMYANYKAKEDEFAQGRNFYATALMQGVQVSLVNNIVQKIAEQIIQGPAIWPVRILFGVVSLVVQPIWFVFGAVRQGSYEQLAKFINDNLNPCIKLPEILDQHVVQAIHCIIDHAGDVMRVAMVVGSCALIALGKPIIGAACLVGLAYQAVDQMGIIPRKISLFMEIHMPLVSNAVMLVTGNIALQILSAASFVMSIPDVSREFRYGIDHVIRSWIPIWGPTVREIEAPVIEREAPYTAEEIHRIIHANHWEFELNPSAFSKWASERVELPEDDDFDKLVTFFDSVSWQDKGEILRRKLLEDEIFLDMLEKSFPGVVPEVVMNEKEAYLEELAGSKQISESQFLADWLRNQVLLLVQGLKGERRVPGTQQEEQEAINNFAKIVPYLHTLQELPESTEFEDVLLKLSVEGGDYCARGVKRASEEILSSLLYRGISHEPGEVFDEDKDYETKVKQALQQQRLSIVQSYFQTIVDLVKEALPRAVRYDVHTFDVYKLYLSLGFYPLTDFECAKIGVLESAISCIYAPLKKEMYRRYDIDAGIKEIGGVNLGDYVRRMVENNPLLDANQKEEILDIFSTANNNSWSIDENNHRFARLLFLKLGILREPQVMAV